MRFANFVTENIKFFEKNVRIQFLTARVRLFRTQWTKYSDVIRDNKQSLYIGEFNSPEKEERTQNFYFAQGTKGKPCGGVI